MEQVYRIEIPIEAVDKTDTAALQRLETVLQKIFTSMKETKSESGDMFDHIARGAAEAKVAMQQMEAAAEKSAESSADAVDSAADSVDDLVDTADEAADALGEVGDAAEQAGQQSGDAFKPAKESVDKFTKQTEKSNKALRSMFKEKLRLTLEAIDRASPILKEIWGNAKNLASKTWHVAVRMKDFITAPFRKLIDMVSSPITMALSVAGIGLSAGEVVQTFNEFESGMSAVRSLTGATDEEFLLLKETAKELGASTSFSASQASEGMQYLAMAGWDTNQIIAAMPGLLDLAAAGATELGTAADIVSDVMTAMGMSAEEAGRAADVFAKTATSSNTTIEGLGETLKYAAPIAYSFGMELEELAAITGMMGDAGIKGSQAGTALRSALLRMADPAAEATEWMEKLNLSFTEGDGTMKTMSSVLRDTNKAFGGLTEAERLAAAQAIFGTEAASAWLAVIEQGPDTYDEFTASLYGAAGAAETMADIRLDNLAGDMEELGGAVETAKLNIMEKLGPYMRSGVQWLTSKIPAMETLLVKAIDSGIAKATAIKDKFSEVFNSSDFKNADGFAEKFFVAWDKIIADPFDEWWSGGGKEKILGKFSELGKGAGELLHGLVVGAFAAIKGEEIDFEGLNITGIGKAGAEAAKSFISSFVGGLDAGDLLGQAPALLKAGLFGFGSIKIGGGVLGTVKTVKALKEAFTGVGAAASTSVPAMAEFGASAAATAGGVAKASTGLAALKTALAAVPVWGWVAAAALAAVAVGVIAYSNAKKQHERDLLDTGKAAAQMAEEYERSVQQISDATAAMETVKTVQLQIEEDTGGNQVVIDNFNAEMDSINGRIVYLEAKIANGTLTKEEIETYQAELNTLEGRIAEVKAILEKGDCTPEQVESYQAELEVLEGRVAVVKAVLKKGECTPEMIAEYQAEIDALKGRTVEVVATLKDEGYSTTQVAVIQEQMNAIQEGEKTVTLIIADKTELTPDQIAAYVSQLTDLMTKKTEYELIITGSGLTPTEIAAYHSELEKINTRRAEIEVKLNKGQGTMTDDEWNSLVSEAATLQAQAADIELVLKGSTMNEKEISDVKVKLGEVRGEAAGILLTIGYSPNSEITQDDITTLAEDLAKIGEMKVQLDIGLKDGSMGVEELEKLNDELNDAYARLIEASDGYFTKEDVEHGRITQERYDNWVRNKTVTAEAERLTFQAQVEKDRGNIAGLVEKREAAEATASYYTSAGDGSVSDYDFLSGLDAQRKLLLGQYQTGQISDEELFEGGQQLIQQARDRQWSDMWGAPANFEAFTPDDLFGKWVGGLFNSHWEADPSVNPFGSALDELGKQTTARNADTEKANAEAAAANAALVQHYQNEVRVVEMDSFAGFGVESENSTKSIQELAENYNTLDAAGQQMFANAIAGLAELNSTTQYITDEEKVNIGDILTQASQTVTVSANVEVLGDIQGQLAALSGEYQTLQTNLANATDPTQIADMNAHLAEMDASNLEAVNTALEALGMEKIGSLGELGTKLEEIAAIDPSGLNFDAAAASLEALGGDATSTQEKVAAAKAQLDALAGTYNVTINYQTTGSVPSTVPGTKVAQNAEGGIYDGAFLSWVAEDGPEAIIPLGSERRERGIDLWLQAGEMLGVHEFADGGIMAPYTGAISNLPDYVLNDEDSPAFTAAPTGGSDGGTQVIEVSVNSSPVFEIKGENAGDIIDALKGRMKELAELLGTEFAEQIADIVTNIA